MCRDLRFRLPVEDLTTTINIPCFTFSIPVPDIKARVIPYVVQREPRKFGDLIWVDKENDYGWKRKDKILKLTTNASLYNISPTDKILNVL